MDKEINNMLFAKLYEEFSEYRKWLTEQPPETILEHGFEYSVKQDILIYVASADLDSDSVELLMTSPTALNDIYDAVNKIELFRHYGIATAIEETADRLYIANDKELEEHLCM